MHTDWLHQAIATRPLTTPRDPGKALLTTDLTSSKNRGEADENPAAEPELIGEQNVKSFGNRHVYA